MPEQNPALTVHVAHQDGSVVIVVTGELDLATAPVLVQRVADVLGHGRPVTLDMRRLTFVDVRGLRGLQEVRQHAEAAGAELRVCVEGDLIPRVVRAARFDGLAGFIEPAGA